MQNLADLRREYSKASLNLTSIDQDPIKQFNLWFKEALTSEVIEPNAMNLSTINENGRPASRIVLLKGVENGVFVFYTNYQSQKGKDLDKNPACALTFFWAELERQVRIEGVAERISSETSEQYFKSRPRGSQIGAWASPQSTIIKDRSILEERVKQLEKKFEGQTTLPKPNQWGGYAVTRILFEFWQGRQSRLHDRVQYSTIDGQWKLHLLAP
jgi:pyridoxamine 5'-phosphate oxidase